MYYRIAAATLALALFTVPSGSAPLMIDRGAAYGPSGTGPGRPVILAQTADTAYRTDQLEEQIRKLNGRVEELGFQLLEMQEHMRKMQEDNEFRFQEIENGKGGGRRGDTGMATTQKEDMSVASQGNAGEGEAEPVMGTLGEVKFNENGAVVEPEENASSAAMDETQTAALPQNAQDPLYHEAYAYILSGDYPLAQQSFERYITEYPDSTKIADAYYWLGEAKFAQGQYHDAAKTLLTAHKQFPNSPKAPDMLLKLGMSLAALDNRDTACATYREVLLRYPNASEAFRKKVAIEQSAMSC